MSDDIASLPRRISPSAVERYRTCPRAAWFQYVARAAAARETSPNLILGNAVHSALDLFFGLHPDHREPAVEVLARCLRSVWKKHSHPGAFMTREEEADWGRQGLRMLQSFAARFDTTARPLAREQWVSIRVAPGVELYGKVDRIDGALSRAAEEEAPPLQIIDYKTGRYQLEPDELLGVPAVQAYIIAVEARYRRPVERVRFIYLASGEEVRLDVEREDVEAAREKLGEMLTTMYADTEFQPNPGEHCHRCAFAHLCPEAGTTDPAEIAVDDEELLF